MSKAISPSFEDFYKRIKEILETTRTKVYQTVNFEMVQSYWNIGRIIVEEEQSGNDRAAYGRKDHALRGELSWTHYRLLLKIENKSAREFYMDETVKGNWSTRQLDRQINSLFYDRTLMSRDKKRMITNGRALQDKMQPEDIIRDPYVLEFLAVKESEKLAERELESALIDKLQHFLLELGTGFSIKTRNSTSERAARAGKKTF